MFISVRVRTVRPLRPFEFERASALVLNPAGLQVAVELGTRVALEFDPAASRALLQLDADTGRVQIADFLLKRMTNKNDANADQSLPVPKEWALSDLKASGEPVAPGDFVHCILVPDLQVLQYCMLVGTDTKSLNLYLLIQL